jgi:acyl-coenzyme A synthetase/AMP-(fatty) acid ligase
MSANRDKPRNWQTPEYFNFGEMVDSHAAADPSRAALLHEDSLGNIARLSFADISHQSSQIANVLSQLGVKPGDAVLLMLPRTTMWHASFVAILKLGAIAVICGSTLRDKEIVARANRCQAVAVVAAPGSAEIVADLRRDCSTLKHFLLAGSERSGWTSLNLALRSASALFAPVRVRSGQPALCFFTAGATGEFKGVLHSSAFAWASRFIASDWLSLKAGSVHWSTADPGTCKAAWSALFAPWTSAATVFMFNGRFDPVHALRLIAKYKITTLCMAPAEYRSLLAALASSSHPPRLGSIGLCTAVGDSLPLDLIGSWHASTGLIIRQGYAQAETGLLIANSSEDQAQRGSIGTPLAGLDIRVLGSDLQETGTLEVGEFAIKIKPSRPPSTFVEYLNDPEKTTAAFRGDFYLTGDHGYRDRNGYFWFVGRDQEIISRAGHRFAAPEIEEALQQHPAVMESVVFSTHHPTRGPIVKAYVKLKPGLLGPLNTDQSDYDREATRDHLARELREHLLRVTESYKVPHDIEFLDALPRTPSGHLNRAAIIGHRKPTRS